MQHRAPDIWQIIYHSTIKGASCDSLPGGIRNRCGDILAAKPMFTENFYVTILR